MRRTCRGILFSATLLGLLCLTAAPGCNDQASPPPAGTPDAQASPAQTLELTIKGERFTLELALDDESRYLGLSDRQAIADDGGMLFVMAAPRHARFVMRRCYVPIDLIYVDADGYIDSLHEMPVIEPIGSSQWENPIRGYASVGNVLFAIELKSGSIRRLGLSRGEQIELPIAALQSRAQ